MRSRTTILLALLAIACAAVPAAVADVCQSEKPDLLGKRFVAKKYLYDTRVAVEGIVKLEWDKEAIPEGDEFEIVDVECDKSGMELTLKPTADRKAAKVEIVFLFKKEARQAPDAKDKLQTIMSHVFAPPKTAQE